MRSMTRPGVRSYPWDKRRKPVKHLDDLCLIGVTKLYRVRGLNRAVPPDRFFFRP